MEDLDYDAQLQALAMFALSGLVLTLDLFVSGIFVWFAMRGEAEWWLAAVVALVLAIQGCATAKALMNSSAL